MRQFLELQTANLYTKCALWRRFGRHSISTGYQRDRHNRNATSPGTDYLYVQLGNLFGSSFKEIVEKYEHPGFSAESTGSSIASCPRPREHID